MVDSWLESLLDFFVLVLKFLKVQSSKSKPIVNANDPQNISWNQLEYNNSLHGIINFFVSNELDYFFFHLPKLGHPFAK